MQQDKIDKFKIASGNVIKYIRENYSKNTSINQLAREYDIDRGNLSKIERGINCCNLITAWKISEASGIKFSKFAELLEKELGEDFEFFD
ncbi:MAG: helix-turn-helix transcriptional regulator [Cyanobacteria bacterium SIG28]|nr:helix-turn-helix transcriptional regulator [Cyanobacteria bacterium SIG28]